MSGRTIDFNILRASYESDSSPEATSTTLVETGFFLLGCVRLPGKTPLKNFKAVFCLTEYLLYMSLTFLEFLAKVLILTL